jgi:hypothetical protein
MNPGDNQMDTKQFLAAFAQALNQSNKDIDFAVKIKLGEEKYESQGSIQTVDELLENYILANKAWMRTDRNNLLVYRTKQKDLVTATQYGESIGLSYSNCYVQKLKPAIALPFEMKRFTVEELMARPYLNGPHEFYKGVTGWREMCVKCHDSKYNTMQCLVYVV